MSGTYVRPESTTLSGLTEGEAREFHRLFLTSFIIFVLVALVAHFFAWQWRPWLPGPNGYATSMLDGARSVGALFSQLA